MSILYEATGGGGHEMIPVGSSDSDISTLAALNTGSDDKVINAYTAKRWANVDVTTLLAKAEKGKDGIGVWNDTWETDGDRSGWMWSADLLNILGDNTIEMTPVFDASQSETVSCCAYRIDDSTPGYFEVTPDSGDDPSAEGWYEKSGTTYVLSADTSVQSGKTYYKRILGGAVAFKFNKAITSDDGVYVGFNIKHQRINLKYFDILE